MYLVGESGLIRFHTVARQVLEDPQKCIWMLRYQRVNIVKLPNHRSQQLCCGFWVQR